MNRIILLAGVSTLAMSIAPALSADFGERFEGRLPAVSGVNAKIEAGYTWFHTPFGDANVWRGAGAVSFPIGERFGLQIDAGLGNISAGGGSGITFGGGAAHLFWRDPETALFGLYTDVVGVGSTGFGGGGTIWRFGAEAELYLDRVSIEAFAGGDHVSGGGTNRTFFSAEAFAALYVTDNVRVHAGIGHRFNSTYGRIGGEAIMPFASNNVALFADATFARNTTTVGGGVRVYFGDPGKSLIDRHRQDDPRIRLLDLFAGPSLVNGGGGGTVPPPSGEGAT